MRQIDACGCAKAVIPKPESLGGELEENRGSWAYLCRFQFSKLGLGTRICITNVPEILLYSKTGASASTGLKVESEELPGL